MIEEIILMNDELIDYYCLVCWLNKGEIILCSKCKYKYCDECAKKLNNTCSICIRIKNQNQDDNEYLYLNEYDNGIIYNPEQIHFMTVTASVVISIIIGTCWLVMSCLFGYIGIIFLINYLYKLFIFIISFIKIIK